MKPKGVDRTKVSEEGIPWFVLAVFIVDNQTHQLAELRFTVRPCKKTKQAAVICLQT
jgi:hypothetical protein